MAIIDIKLPGFEGIELLERMEKTDPRMRKIIVTGYETLKNTIQALSMGADGYLVKPVKPEELLDTVKIQLEEREREFRERHVLLEDPKG